MSIDWSQLADLIARRQRFVVTTHVRPDGDALGSTLGMVGYLRQLGKDVRAIIPSQTPPRYDYLDPDGTIFEHFGHSVTAADLADRDALIILDLSSWSQMGDVQPWARSFTGERLVIDHHVSQDDMGATVLKDTSAEATGSLVARAITALRGTFTPQISTGLLTAILMDTGWFHHPNTKPETLRVAAELVEHGAAIDDIYRKLFERSTLGRIKLIGQILAKVETTDQGRIAYSTVTRQDFVTTGAIPADTEDLIDYTVCIEGVEVGVLLIEQIKGGIKLSLRSRNGVDCSALASQFGGGGHKAAAGANLPDPMSESLPRVLSAVKQALDA